MIMRVMRCGALWRIEGLAGLLVDQRCIFGVFMSDRANSFVGGIQSVYTGSFSPQ